VQQEIHGHQGRKGDPLYRIRNILRAGEENLTDRQRHCLETAFAADERHVEVELAWRCAQQVRSAYHQDTHAAGRVIAEKILASFGSCPIPEVARLGRTLKQWREAFLGYFTTSGANNGGTEAVNGLIELHRRIARGFRNRDNYRLRMLLIGYDYDPTLRYGEPRNPTPNELIATVSVDLTDSASVLTCTAVETSPRCRRPYKAALLLPNQSVPKRPGAVVDACTLSS
jgi:Transposase